MVGRKASTVEKWDMRLDSSHGAVMTVTVPSNYSVMDFDASYAHDVLLVASNNKVSIYSNSIA